MRPLQAVPKDKFVVMDMSVNGDGEWKKWDDAAYWGAQFVWTSLHDFGGSAQHTASRRTHYFAPYPPPRGLPSARPP